MANPNAVLTIKTMKDRLTLPGGDKLHFDAALVTQIYGLSSELLGMGSAAARAAGVLDDWSNIFEPQPEDLDLSPEFPETSK